MNRRAFLKTIGLGIVAAAAPAILVPTRTIIDMHTRPTHIIAEMGQDLSYLMDSLAPGGLLYISGGVYWLDRPIRVAQGKRLMMQNTLVYLDHCTGIYFTRDHGQSSVTYNQFRSEPAHKSTSFKWDSPPGATARLYGGAA